MQADLIFSGGNLITLNSKQRRATAMAVAGDRIVYVGDDAGANAFASPSTKRIGLEGKTVTPGFIDSHIHLLMYGTMLARSADLIGSGSIEEVLERLTAQAAKTSGWLQGHGFDQDKLREKRFPTREELDRVSRDRPIIISRICGHATVVNSAAMAMVTDAERDAGDVGTGLYTEDDSGAFYRLIPPLMKSRWSKRH